MMDSLLDADAHDGYQFTSARRRPTAASTDYADTPSSTRSGRRPATASVDYSDDGGSVTAPSSVGHYDRRVELAEDEERMLTALATTLLEKLTRTYEEEEEHGNESHVVDKTRWKRLKTREQLTVYKERDSSSSSSSSSDRSVKASPPQLLLTGSVPGRVEDALYGLASASSRAMKFQSAYAQDARVVDADVLATIDGPRVDAPFRFLGLKWVLQQHQHHASSAFAKKRDVVFLEATGMTTLPTSGDVVGYHVVHSVHLHSRNRLLSGSSTSPVVRATTSLGYLFRQRQHTSNSSGDSVVDVFARGYYDPHGGLLQFVALALAAEQVLVTVTNAFECAQLKKLSHAAHESSRMRRHRAATTATTNGRAPGRPTTASDGSTLLADMAAAAQEVDREAVTAATVCAVCARKLGSRLQRGGGACTICTLVVCGRCTVTKKLSFTREDTSASLSASAVLDQQHDHHLERSGTSVDSSRSNTQPARSASSAVKSVLSSALSVHSSSSASASPVQREICQKPMAFCTRCILTTNARRAELVAAEELRLEHQTLAPPPFGHVRLETQQPRRTTQHTVRSVRSRTTAGGAGGGLRTKTPRAKAFSTATTAPSTAACVVLYEEPTAVTV